jgi:hypothetical protein
MPAPVDSNACAVTLITDVTSARDGHTQEAVEMTIEYEHAPIGLTTSGEPVWAARGAAIEFAVGDDDGRPDDELFNGADDDDDEDDDDSDEDERPAVRTRKRTTSGDDDSNDWTPPDRESWERMQTALKRANGEAGKRRRFGKLMDRLGIDDPEAWLSERGIDPATGLPYGGDVVDPRDDTEDDGYEREDDVRRRGDRDERDERTRDRELTRQVRTAEQRGRTAERDRLMPALLESSARLALREAGFSGNKSQLDRMLRTIDPRDLEVDVTADDVELVGIDEEVERLKEDFPEFFRTEEPPARRRAAANGRTASNGGRPRGAREVDGGNRGRQPAAPRGWKEQAVAQMMNR